MRADSSSAFSWKPYGVSINVAGAAGSPSRSSRARCTLAMAGAVSPEPMIARIRGPLTATTPSTVISCSSSRHLVRVLGMEVVVARHPVRAGVRDGRLGRLHGRPLPIGPVGSACVRRRPG